MGNTEINDCPVCYAYEEDLTYRGGICETCYQDSDEASPPFNSPVVN